MLCSSQSLVDAAVSAQRRGAYEDAIRLVSYRNGRAGCDAAAQYSEAVRLLEIINKQSDLQEQLAGVERGRGLGSRDTSLEELKYKLANCCLSAGQMPVIDSAPLRGPGGSFMPRSWMQTAVSIYEAIIRSLGLLAVAPQNGNPGVSAAQSVRNADGDGARCSSSEGCRVGSACGRGYPEL
jgi:hypothetical protein